MLAFPSLPYILRPTFTILFLVNVLFHSCQCIRFELAPNSRRCLKHEVYANQLAVGEYEISDLPDTVVDLSITDTKGYSALKRDNINGKGKFAVTSDDADYFDICFTYSSTLPSTQLPSREIYLDFRVGVEAKQYDSVDHDKFSELEKDLSRVEDLTQAIISDFAYLRKREREMRNTNESTNTRLFYQTILSLIILVVLTTWQVLYLRTYFRARKLID